jgi:hypothetical protein
MMEVNPEPNVVVPFMAYRDRGDSGETSFNPNRLKNTNPHGLP